MNVINDNSFVIQKYDSITCFIELFVYVSNSFVLRIISIHVICFVMEKNKDIPNNLTARGGLIYCDYWCAR